MADKCRISSSTISRYERGETFPNQEVLNVYCETFDVTMEYLTGYAKSNKNENMKVAHNLGITDDTIETLELINAFSDNANDYISVINAFINNKEFTLGFTQNILKYVTTVISSTDNGDIGNIDDFKEMMEIEFIKYLRQNVFPQLIDIAKKNIKYSDFLQDAQYTHNQKILTDYSEGNE